MPQVASGVRSGLRPMSGNDRRRDQARGKRQAEARKDARLRQREEGDDQRGRADQGREARACAGPAASRCRQLSNGPTASRMPSRIASGPATELK